MALLSREDRTLSYRWEWRLPVAPESLWRRVADTNRFNRDADLPTVEGDTPGFCTVRNGRRHLKLRQYGVALEWDEDPFEWVWPRAFGVVRRYRTGPMREMRVRVRLLDDDDGGTRVVYDVDAVPRNVATAPLVRFAIGVVSRVRFRKLFEHYAAQAARDPVPMPLAPPLPLFMRNPATLVSGGHERLDRASKQLRTTIQPELLDHLVHLITHGDDATLLRMRPYALADIWHVPRTGALRAFFHATRAGIITLQWDVVCPLCRGAKATADTLSELQSHVYCECCHANIDADEFERAVELTFRPAAAIRQLDAQPYCVGGPMVTPHIVAQQLVSARDRRTLDLTLDPGEYRLRALDRSGGRSIVVERREHGNGRAVEDAAEIAIAAGDWPREEVHIDTRTRLTIRNEGDVEELIILERRAWADDAVTAAQAFRIQDFRDLFTRELLRAGQHLSVGSAAVLFTDVRESTRLYREIGDAVAFTRIREHFDILRNAVIRENGVLVKTIGDAVMAVFETPAAGVRAIMRAAEALGSEPDGVQPVQIKAGLHYGPCIAVTLNGALDYFGSTVNIAARLGALAHGGDIVISTSAFEDGELAALAETLGLVSSPFDAMLKGVSEVPVQVWRIAGTHRFGRC